MTPGTKYEAPNTMQGFTLLELSIVLAVIASLLGGGIVLMSAALDRSSYSSTATKLRILQQALYDYRLAHNRLPCPANSTDYLTSDGNFGLEADTAGNCRGGTPAADDSDASVAIGMVPVRTLGLPDDMAIDSWGRRIRYAVSPALVTSPAFVISTAFDDVPATDTTTRLTVNHNDPSETITTTAAYVLISYGANGHGGRGGSKGTLVNAATTNSNELLNCKCSNNGSFDSGVTPGTFVQGDPKPDPTDRREDFDDLVVFASRVDLRDADE